MILLRLRIAARSEKKLRSYVKKHFKMTLEKQLMNVLIEWIGKAIDHISELQRNSKKEV